MSHPVDIHVGQKLKQLRALRGMTQTDVAHGLEISFQQVQKYELGRNRISASRLFELSQILDVPPSHFFDGLDDETRSNEMDAEATRIASMVARIKDSRVRSQIRSFITEIAT